MKKILVVGFMGYGYKEKLVKTYPNVLWFSDREVGMSDSAFALIELVEMMDGVMFMDKDGSKRMSYEVACCMAKKPIHEKDDLPVEEEKPIEKVEEKEAI